MFKFIKSSSNESNWLVHSGVEICFWGRSNVGKSSLINSITNISNLARVSKTPGRTQLLNYFADENKVIVDLPGYGYAKMSTRENDKMNLMIQEYLENSTNLRHIFLLLDSRRGITEIDSQVISYIKALQKPITFVFTKLDKLNQSEKSKLSRLIKEIESEWFEFDYVLVSTLKKTNIDKLKDKIEYIFKGE